MITTRTTQHATFTLERTYPATRERVFRAWSSVQAKSRWFACHPEWQVYESAVDFRVGGREVWRVGPQGGVVHSNETVYHDIVPGERIIYSYAMQLGDQKVSVSLATIEFADDGAGTRLVFTEQGAFLDGYDDAGQREEGTRLGLESLRAALQRGDV